MTAKPPLVDCQAQRVPGGPWMPAWRREEPHHVEDEDAVDWALAQEVEEYWRVEGGPWFSVCFAEDTFWLPSGHEVRGGSGWREIPAAQVREPA